MEKDSKIYIAGHRGMVGSAITRRLKAEGYSNLLVRTSSEMDLRNQQQVCEFFQAERPDFVFLAAAKVGGIIANNTFRADFLYENLMIQSNIIHSAHVYKTRKLLFLGSSCIYPKLAPQPLKEEYLLTGELEPTNEPYAIAKISGIKMCDAYRAQYGDNFISVMPTNLFGPNDNYDLTTSHVLPALIRKFHEAKTGSLPHVTLWGSGKPFREFMHSDDIAAACMYLMNHFDQAGFINVGTGKDCSIYDLAMIIKGIVGYEGDVIFDSTKPDGTPRKLMDVSKLNALGWRSSISLEEGIRTVYEDYKLNLS